MKDVAEVARWAITLVYAAELLMRHAHIHAATPSQESSSDGEFFDAVQ
eukprot:CAMPEP_0170171802 /NCGR_PEP_ID=MMETSP0040_2-20121228/4985_1 /TAXON_ID=641309 /ORGANISM="Lotharella oceanica, Strain CCMP622" /LENGTH=47 /DNA_ID= /DNA_START= /DNA_END= /DNA_ORIENTATION=